MYSLHHQLRNRFHDLQRRVANAHNNHGRGVIMRTPDDATIAIAARRPFGLEALARSHTKAIG